jgi:hypothetical protein
MVFKTVNLEGPLVEPEQLRGDPHHLTPLLEGALRYLRPEKILDATAGSGVTARVAADFQIPCTVSDLNDPRDPTDLFEIKENGFDLIIYHPDLWCARRDAEHPNDLGGDMDWDEYVQLNTDAMEHLAERLSPDGAILLVAPIARRSGTVYSLARELASNLGDPREPEIVHPHPQCLSRGTLYGKRFIPIAHDQVLLWRREELLDEEPQSVLQSSGTISKKEATAQA